jgi:integrase/recombinase XerD
MDDTAGGAVSKYLDDRRKRGELNRRTVNQQRGVLARFAAACGDKPSATITVRDVDRWMRGREHLAPGSRRAEWSTVNAFLAWLVRTGTLRRNPLDGERRPSVPRSVPAALPPDAVARLLAVADGDVRLTAVLWAALGLGLRRSEIVALDVEHWDRFGGTVRVVGKFGHERLLPVTPQVEAAWLELLAADPAHTGPLFRNRRGGRLHPGTVTAWVARAMTEAGVKRGPWDRACAHALRHTAASDTLDACGDLRVVMAMLGHRDLSTTSIYQRRAQVGQLRAAMSVRPY